MCDNVANIKKENEKYRTEKNKRAKKMIRFDNNKTHQTSKFKTDSEILTAKHSFKISEEKYEDKRRVITRKLV